MNVVQSINSRENGFKFLPGYDIALLRLKCHKDDVYQGVAANTNTVDYNPKPPTFACEFSSAFGHEHIIALANEDGRIALQDTTVKSTTDEPLEGIQAHNNAIFDIAWMPQETKLITASGDRSASLWDVSSDIRKLQSFQGHTHSIKSAVFRYQDKAVFATGARDGTIMIWDSRARHNTWPKPDDSIFNAHDLKVPQGAKLRRTSSKNKISQSVTALAFQNDHTLFSCSAGDGLIKAWDLRKNYSTYKKDPIAKYTMKYGGKSNTYNGFTSLSVCPAGITLYASCIDEKIYAYNISSYNPNPVSEYYGHGLDNKVLSFFVKACLSPDGEYLVSGSNDETAYIWRTKNPGTPIIKLSGHRDEVTCVAWCSVGETKIVTCSDDCYHRIWRVRPEPMDENDCNVSGCAERYERSPNFTPSKLSISSTPPSAASSMSWSTENCRKSILSPIPENLESSPRRSSPDSRAARKLYFSPSSRNSEFLASPSRASCTGSSCESDASTSTTPFSPTSGLPNFVVDGTAPHLLANSPQKSKENVVDWLTQIRKRKNAERATDDSPSPKHRKTPVRKINKLSRSGKLKKSNKTSNSIFFSPAITNFYNNLNLGSEPVPLPCSE